MRLITLTILGFALGACGSEDGTSPASTAGSDSTGGSHEKLVRFEDETSGISLEYPRGWHVLSRPLTQVGYPPQKLVIASFAVRQARPDQGCRPRTAIEQMPAGGALIYMFEYRRYANRARHLARFPRRPAHFELREQTRVEYECFGLSYGLHFRDRGRAFQAHVYLGRRATKRARSRVLRALDSLTVEPAHQILPALARPPYMGVACRKPNSIACDRVGLAIWLEKPATGLDVTIAGRSVTMRSPGTFVTRSGARTRWEGFLQPAGLKEGALEVRPEPGTTDRWVGREPVSAHVRITAHYRDRTSASRTLRVRLRTGWG